MSTPFSLKDTIKTTTKFNDENVTIIYNYMRHNTKLWSESTIDNDLPKIIPKALKHYQNKRTTIFTLIVYCIINITITIIFYLFETSKPLTVIGFEHVK